MTGFGALVSRKCEYADRLGVASEHLRLHGFPRGGVAEQLGIETSPFPVHPRISENAEANHQERSWAG